VIGRGGQGVANIEVTQRNGPVVASFPVGEDDQIMLVTNRGKLIRCPVHDIRIARRQTQGVTVFRVGEDEEVVAVAHLSDLGEDEGGNGEAAPETHQWATAASNGTLSTGNGRHWEGRTWRTSASASIQARSTYQQACRYHPTRGPVDKLVAVSVNAGEARLSVEAYRC
jgi:hypothetical protein